jgi:Chlorophyll A-B binding protein
MKGGKIGEFPKFDAKVIPGGALNLYDPFGISSKNSDERKASGLVKEINNGRLAMLGVFGFLCEAKITGSVPALTGIIPHYDGEFMAPMTTNLFPTL